MRPTAVLKLAVVVAAALLAGPARADLGTLADSNGQLAAWGLNDEGQCNVPAGTYSAIAGGAWHSLAIRSDGTLAAWGYNGYGQCDVPTTGTYTAVDAGWYHSLAIRSNGTLAAWGWNSEGQCNVPAGTYTAVAGGRSHNLALRSDGTVSGGADLPSGAFVAVAAGGYHNLALRARIDYDGDLLVNGAGMQANLNRSITVAGIASIESMMYLYNNPTMAVAGTTTVASTGGMQGTGTINGFVSNHGLINGGSGLAFNGLVSGEGNYAGHVAFNGGFSPGNSPASVTGEYFTFGPGNILTMELGGTALGTEYDHLIATGEFTLGGTLDVELINGFVPSLGNTFDLFDGPMNCEFSTLDLPTLSGGLYWDTGQLYNTGVITVSAQSGVVPEPFSLAFMGIAFAGVVARVRRRRRGAAGNPV